MIEILKLVNKDKYGVYYVLLLTIIFALLEGAGIGTMLPILQYVENGGVGDVTGLGSFFIYVQEFLDPFGIRLNLTVLITMAATPMLLRQMALYFKTILISKIEFDYRNQIRKKIINGYLGAGLPFFLHQGQGKLTSNITTECDQSSIIVRSLLEMSGNVLLLTIYISLLAVLSLNLTLIAIPVFVLSALIIKKQLNRGRELGTEIGQNSQAFNEEVSETIKSIRLIKSRGLEGESSARLERHSRKLSDCWVNMQKTQSLIEATVNPILILGVFFILYMAVDVFYLKLSELGMFLFIIGRTSPLMLQLNNSRLTIQSANRIRERVDNMYEASVKTLDSVGGEAKFEHLKNRIKFENVFFNYKNKEDTLKNINFEVNKGEMIALVGPSGAGKTTLVDLMPRFNDLSRGIIYFDHRSISDFSLKELRRKIAYVSQDPVFFHDTIRSNIEVGLDEPLSQKRLEWCLKKSCSDVFVSQLSNGPDTILGEQGRTLSGGQRQRLAIARALAQEAEILILDEPTSALDAASEARIQESLEVLRGRLTIFIIAHRLSTVRYVDKIIFMEDGEVKGIGSHEHLLEQLPAYKNLVKLQEYKS